MKKLSRIFVSLMLVFSTFLQIKAKMINDFKTRSKSSNKDENDKNKNKNKNKNKSRSKDKRKNKNKRRLLKLKRLTDELKTLSTSVYPNLPEEITRKSFSFQQILQIAEEREKLILKLMRAGKYKMIDKLAIDERLRARFPDYIKEHIETKVNYKGDINVTFEEVFFEIQDSIDTIYTLELDDGSALTAYSRKGLDLSAGERLQVSGYQIGEYLIIAQVGEIEELDQRDLKFRKSKKNKKRAHFVAGDQKLLVVLLQDQDSPEPKLSKDDVRTRFFGSSDSVASFFKNSSYNKVQLSGEVTNWIKIPNKLFANLNSNYSGFYGATKKILAQLERKGIPTASYSRYVFVLDNKSHARERLFSQGLRGYGSVGKASFRLAGRKKKLSFSFLLANSVNSAFAMHEVGHNFGALHANSYKCSGDIVASSQCKEYEYGDVFSVMGNKTQSDFSAARKEQFGWLSKSQILRLDEGFSGELILTGIDSGLPGLKGIKIPKKNGAYYIEFHQQKEHQDDQVFSRYGGALVRFVTQQGVRAKTKLLDMTPASAAGFFDGALTEGNTFRDRANGVELTTVNVSANQLTLRIKT